MARPKRQDGRTVRVRALIEAAQLELVDHDQAAPLVRLRIEQALRRSGWTDLLGPALDDFDRMVTDVAQAKVRQIEAINALLGCAGAPVKR